MLGVRPSPLIDEERGLVLMQAWVQLLQRRRWQWFVTLTFRDDVHAEAADKRFYEFLGELQRRREELRFLDDTAIQWAVSSERQRRGVLHFHVLLANVGKLPYAAIQTAWCSGHAWVEGVKGNSSVIRYCSKYVVKGGHVMLGEGTVPYNGWPRRVAGYGALSRAMAALEPDERETLVAWALSDRRPSTRPESLLQRARAAATAHREKRKGKEQQKLV
jgi:hypothetical protein